MWDDAQAPALGTAPAATFWVALEQNGPWGAQAATQSHLDPDLGRTLTQLCQDAAGRFMLVRRPGMHSDLHDGRPQRVYLAGGLATRPWLLEADIEDPARLAKLAHSHLAAMAGGATDVVQELLPELEPSLAPVLMICSNSRRDVCCSVRGRPVAAEAGSQRPGRVWECSHTGGHRFAPTGVLLPYGATFARLSGRSAVTAVDAATREEVPLELLGAMHDRGRSHLSAPGQAAESVVRNQIHEAKVSALTTQVAPEPGRQDAWQCRVRHVDGRSWDVVSVRRPSADALPESCGKEPVPRWQWSVFGDSVNPG
jgi:hypothetical protein